MDEWPIVSSRFSLDGHVVVDSQPKTCEDRCALAKSFTEKYSMNDINFLVDKPELDDPFEKVYSPWPIRLYLVENGKIKWIAEPHRCSFEDSIAELLEMLDLNKVKTIV